MFESFGLSDAGCVRGNNEDYFLIAHDLGLCIVADGMGGAQAGECASRLAAETVADYLASAGRGGDNPLVEAFNAANQCVSAAASAESRLQGMGTTLVAALDRGDHIQIASVGDSRAYLFEDGALRLITQDQTWVNDVGRRLGLDEATLKTHPLRHVLTIAIGVSASLRVNTYNVRPAPGAVLLLCSDGLHGVVDDNKILNTLSGSPSLEAAARELVAVARQAGGPDNITTVLSRLTAAAAF
jgi:PPM family protein phosphatase